MAPGPNHMLEKATSNSSIVDEEHQAVEESNNENKSPRHPRWTKQETLVLIEGKKIAESQGRKGRRFSPIFGTGQLEPKWDSVSSYCKFHGVNRGPVQCRKRWSNLASDFKKIKIWESQVNDEGESFWTMRNDVKREKKLPGYFDREIYAVLDGRAYGASNCQISLMTTSAEGKGTDGICTADTEDEDEKEDNEGAQIEPVYDSSSHARPEDSLFSDIQQCAQGKVCRRKEVKVARESLRNNSPAPMPLSEKQYQQFHQAYSNQGPAGKQPGSHFWRRTVFEERKKKRRLSLDGCQDINLSHHLITVLERSTNVLNAQFESQRINCQLEREQQKAHSDILTSTLSKISDALAKIADKL